MAAIFELDDATRKAWECVEKAGKAEPAALTVSPEYRRRELEMAQTQAMLARGRYNAAKTRKAKREADEDIEFWTNKAAFLANAK